jgi:D-glycero-D-manno-heptose 1,7-bisphosphate phosphatase
MAALGNTVSTVFLDRDGTLNVKPASGQYITSPDDLILLPGAAHAVARLNAAGVRTILVTNQRWLCGPSADPVRYAAVQARLERLLAAQGAWLDASYYCPHAIGACDCRKPGAGMLTRAARALRFDLRTSVVVGDNETDLMAGLRVGAATILLRSEAAAEAGRLGADAVAPDLPAAVCLILRTRNGLGGGSDITDQARKERSSKSGQECSP